MTSIKSRTLYNIVLPGALPGIAGALRHVLEVLAEAPDAVPDGLHFKLSGSLRDRLLRLGMPAGLVPEFTGIVQHLGVARLLGAGKATVWFVMDPTFAVDLIREPWISKAFEDHLERAEMLSTIRALRPVEAKDPTPVTTPASIPIDQTEALRQFFVVAFEDLVDPNHGPGMSIYRVAKRYDQSFFGHDLAEAVKRLEAEGFLRTDIRHPALVWRGKNFPNQLESPPASVLRVVGK